jgi:DNA-binding LytR/AlgR family response regulator
MQIAVCDDNVLELEHIIGYLNTYQKKWCPELIWHTFQSGMQLCTTMRAGTYDAIFLDILMPGMNGMETARDIRRIDESVKIIFLTSSSEFALESYEVRATNYLLKPISDRRLFDALDELRREEKNIPEGFSFKTQNSLVHISYNSLSFVEVRQKHLYFNLVGGDLKTVSAPLREVETDLLDRPEFCKVHRSFIVNLNRMRELTGSDLISCDGARIPISRLLYPQVRQQYMEWLFADVGGNEKCS